MDGLIYYGLVYCSLWLSGTFLYARVFLPPKRVKNLHVGVTQSKP